MKHKFVISGLLLIPIVLVILPANFFDNGESICLSKLIFDIECYGCGMTRAIQHLIHFDIQIAVSFNPLSIVIFPILFFVWLKLVIKYYYSLRNN